MTSGFLILLALKLGNFVKDMVDIIKVKLHGKKQNKLSFMRLVTLCNKKFKIG